MSKSFDLSKSSDKHRFTQEIERAIKNKAKEAISHQSFEVACPKCNNHFSATSGVNFCPFCGKDVKVELNINL